MPGPAPAVESVGSDQKIRFAANRHTSTDPNAMVTTSMFATLRAAVESTIGKPLDASRA